MILLLTILKNKNTYNYRPNIAEEVHKDVNTYALEMRMLQYQ